jgi:type IV pilus assembly protein PilA
MKSVKCPQCGFVGWADAESCKKCGAEMASQPAYASAAIAPQPDYGSGESGSSETVYYAPPRGGFQQDLKQGLAVTAMVVGILNFLFLGIFGITTIAGIVISAIAMKKIKRYPHLYGGHSFALTGLIMNIVSLVFLIPVLIILAIAVPNLYASRRAANEGSAINSLRKIHAAESTYQATAGRGDFGNIEDLHGQNLIAAELASGTRHGYRFQVEAVKDTGEGLPGFIAVAVPTDYGSTGKRSFFVDETGVIRAADSHGMEATKYDPPVNFERDHPSNRSASRRSQSIED